MPVQEEDIRKVEAARKRQAGFISEAGALGAGAKTLGSRVMERVRGARAERGTSQLATDIGEATGHLARQPALIRQRTADVRPLDVDVITARERAASMGQLATLAQFGKETEGTMADWLAGGTSQLLAAATTKEAEAKRAKQEADELMEMLSFRAGEEERTFQQWATREGLRIQEQRAGGAGGITPSLQFQMYKWFTERGEEQEQEKAEVDYKIESINRAITILKKKKISTGPLVGRAMGITARFDPEIAELQNLMGRIAAEEMFRIGGKVLPAQEIARLRPFIPEVTKTKSQNILDLEEFKKQLRPQYQSLMAQPGGDMSSFMFGGGGGEWEITE